MLTLEYMFPIQTVVQPDGRSTVMPSCMAWYVLNVPACVETLLLFLWRSIHLWLRLWEVLRRLQWRWLERPMLYWCRALLRNFKDFPGCFLVCHRNLGNYKGQRPIFSIHVSFVYFIMALAHCVHVYFCGLWYFCLRVFMIYWKCSAVAYGWVAPRDR